MIWIIITSCNIISYRSINLYIYIIKTHSLSSHTHTYAKLIIPPNWSPHPIATANQFIVEVDVKNIIKAVLGVSEVGVWRHRKVSRVDSEVGEVGNEDVWSIVKIGSEECVDILSIEINTSHKEVINTLFDKIEIISQERVIEHTCRVDEVNTEEFVANTIIEPIYSRV